MSWHHLGPHPAGRHAFAGVPYDGRAIDQDSIGAYRARVRRIDDDGRRPRLAVRHHLAGPCATRVWGGSPLIWSPCSSVAHIDCAVAPAAVGSLKRVRISEVA